MAAPNGITDPQDPNFVPYYERQGLAAEGMADEWLANYSKSREQGRALLPPKVRELADRENAQWVQGQYANLKAYEIREVRRGKVNAITQSAEDAATRVMWSVGQQTSADLRGRDRELEDARKEYEDSVRALSPEILSGLDEKEKAQSEAAAKMAKDRLDERTRLAMEDFGTRADNHFHEMLDEIENVGRQFDAGVADRLYDEHEGRVRKQKAARATIQNVVGSLVADGALDAAERFVTLLETEMDTDSDMPVAGRYGFAPAEIKAMQKDIEQARKAKEREAKIAESEAKDAARDAAREQEIKTHLRPIPQDDEAQAAYFEQMGAQYADLAKDPSLDAATRLSYAKTAESLGFRAVGERNASAAARKAAEREAAREADARLKEAREQIFTAAETDFNAGGFYDDKGEWHDMDANEMAERARDLLNQRKITKLHFNRLMTIQKPKLDEENLAFRDMVLADAKKLLPNIGYRNARFQFRPTKDKAVTQSTGIGFETGSRWYWSNPRSEWTYGQLVEAMNLTLDWQRIHKASAVEAKAHFDDLVKGIVSGQLKANVDAALEDERQMIKDWRNARGH